MEIEGEVDGGSRRGTLVLFPGALGDAVCFEPAADWLAEGGPLTICARGAAAEVAELFPCRPAISSLDGRDVARLFAPLGGSSGATRWLARWERVVSFTGENSPEVVARLGRVGGLLLPFPRRSGATHAIDEMSAAVSGGSAPVGRAPRLRLPDPVGEPPSVGRPERLSLHPGSGGSSKRAPREVFVEIARRWEARAGREATVVLGPAEAGEAAWWADRLDRVRAPGRVGELAGLLARSDVHLGNDAGPSHVAAALGVSTVVLFTTTEPARFGPRGRRVRPIVGAPGRAPAVDVAWEAVEAGLP